MDYSSTPHLLQALFIALMAVSFILGIKSGQMR